MNNRYSNPTVTDCTFSGNTATSGGGMYNYYSAPMVTNCTFLGNSATSGGGMANNNSDATVTNCTFSGNSATGGGGMNNDYGNVTVTNCTFTGNTATGGGGISTQDSSTTISNCSFSVNWANSLGGAAYFHASSAGPSPTVNNCIFWGNDAMYNGKGAGSYEIWLGGYADPVVNYTNIQGGGFPGISNIDADPLFIDADGPDNIPGTPDDDLHLLPDSPCFDAADNTAVPADTPDLDGDDDTTEPIPFDLDGNPRFVEDPNTPDTGNGTAPIVDMGAYEFQVACPLLGDLNSDLLVNGLDLMGFTDCLITGGDCACADMDGVNGVTLDDLDEFLAALLGP
jgi:predicted outer membrane repeat protein